MDHRRLGVVAILLAAAVMSLGVPTASTAGGSSTIQRVEEAGVSLEYPGTWHGGAALPARAPCRRGQVGQARSRSRGATARRGEVAPTGCARFGAAELDDTPSGYHNAIVIQLVPRSLPSSDDVAARQADLERRGYTVATSSPVFGSATGVRIDMAKPSVTADGATVALLVAKLLVPLGNRTAMIDVRTVDDAAGRSVVDAIQGSVRPLRGSRSAERTASGTAHDGRLRGDCDQGHNALRGRALTDRKPLWLAGDRSAPGLRLSPRPTGMSC